ncbi:MAG: DUF1573 domain-containing protein [Cyclobacteriaceae bacterium]
MTRIIFSFLFITLFATSFAQQAKQLAFREETHDFGTIDEQKGPVAHEFVFTNNSPRPVKILKVQASCGCTTPGWSKEVIPPGKEGFIQASYDPKGRPGFFTKSLTVTTDLDANPIILQIKGQVSHPEEPVPSDYPVAVGNLKMRVSSFNMGRVFIKDEYVVREFPVMNAGSDPVTFTGKFMHPQHIKVDVQPMTLRAGEKAVIKIRYNGALKNQYGFQADNIELETNDQTNPVKSFSVYATLEDFFPKMTAAALASAPHLTFESSSLDFGNIPGNTATEKEILFTNTGKKELVLKSIQPNCSCVTATASKMILKPGEGSTLRITFNPQERSGTQNKAISLYSNDPANPVQRLTFTAYVP